MTLLRRVLLVLVLLLGQAHDLLPHHHGIDHAHAGQAFELHIAGQDHHVWAADADDHHRHLTGHYDRCEECQAGASVSFVVAALPPPVPTLVLPILDFAWPSFPEYRPDLPNAPPPELSSRGPPSGIA